MIRDSKPPRRQGRQEKPREMIRDSKPPRRQERQERARVLNRMVGLVFSWRSWRLGGCWVLQVCFTDVGSVLAVAGFCQFASRMLAASWRLLGFVSLLHGCWQRLGGCWVLSVCFTDVGSVLAVAGFCQSASRMFAAFWRLMGLDCLLRVRPHFLGGLKFSWRFADSRD